MRSSIIFAVVLSALQSNVLGCSDWHWGCCNIAGQNCDGPCWNAGCATNCPAGNGNACPGNDGYFNCCPDGSTCKDPSACAAQKGECCCTGAAVEIISLSNIEYDWNSHSSTPDDISAQIYLLNEGENFGSSDSSAPKLAQTISTSQTSSWSFESDTKISVEAKVTAGIPFFGEGELKIGAEETFKYSEEKTTSSSISINIDTGSDTIPAYSRRVWEFSAEMTIINVPFTATATVTTDCGTQTTTTINGNMKLSGVASFTQGKYVKKAGPVVPVECSSPFGILVDDQQSVNFCPTTPSIYCNDNILCRRAGLIEGVCCAPGSMDGCCAQAEAHPVCSSYKNGTLICPSPHGYIDPCCSSHYTGTNDVQKLATIENGTAKFTTKVLYGAKKPNVSSDIKTQTIPVQNKKSSEPLKAFLSVPLTKSDQKRSLDRKLR